MTILLAVLTLLTAGEPVQLKDRAVVGGRYVKLSDLVETGLIGDVLAARFEKVYLGRAPEEGKTRTIDIRRIRRELEVRGIDPVQYEFVGGPVTVAFSKGTRLAAEVRQAIAFEIKRLLLESREVVRADEFAVRIVRMSRETFPGGATVKAVRPLGPKDSEAPEYTVVLERADGMGHWDLDVTARVLPVRRVVVAAREIPRGRTLTAEDLATVRRASAEPGVGGVDLAAFLGGRTLAPVARGTALRPGKVRMKPVIRRGEVVRVVSPSFEVDARALEDGARGQEIKLSYLGTRSQVRGRITGPGRVRVEDRE